MNIEKFSKDKDKALVFFVLTIVLFLINIIVTAFLTIYAIILFLPIIFSFFTMVKYISTLNKKFNKEVIFQLVRICFKNGVYIEKGSQTKQDYLKSKMVKGDKVYFTSTINATHNNIKFDFSNLLVQNDTINASKKETVFDGTYIRIYKNMHIKENVQINELKELNVLSKYKKVYVENSEFNKYFNVYAEEKVDAYYFLKDELMNCLLDFKKKYDCKIYYHYFDKVIYVGLDGYKREYSINFFERINTSSYKKLYLKMEEIKKIIEILYV